MKTYQGHRSWNAWNISLWINNDESLYRIAMDCIKRANNKAGHAAFYFMRDFVDAKTPDGAVYNYLSVKLCLQGFINNA